MIGEGGDRGGGHVASKRLGIEQFSSYYFLSVILVKKNHFCIICSNNFN